MLIRLTTQEVVQLLVAQIMAQRPELGGIGVEASARIRVEGNQPVLDGVDLVFNVNPTGPAPAQPKKQPGMVSIATLIEQVNAAGVVECVLTADAWNTLKAQSPQFQYYEIDWDKATKSHRLVVGRSKEDLEVFLDRG